MKDKKFLTQVIIIYGIACIVWLGSIVGIGYFILHPEIIGHWLSRLISSLK